MRLLNHLTPDELWAMYDDADSATQAELVAMLFREAIKNGETSEKTNGYYCDVSGRKRGSGNGEEKDTKGILYASPTEIKRGS